jgi:hypothetical protein
MLYHTYGASYVLYCKNGKVIAKMWGLNARKEIFAFGFQNLI